MLETLREYASARLEESGENEEMRQRHADWILELAEEADDGLQGADLATWVRTLEQEQANLRAALGFWAQRQQTSAQLALFSHTEAFWYVSGRWVEGRRWLEPALARADGDHGVLRAKALQIGGMFALFLDDWASAKRLGAEALSSFRERGDALGAARSLDVLGIAAAQLEQHADAARLFEEAIAAGREVGERTPTVAISTTNLGVLALRCGQHERAITLTEEAVRITRELGRDDLTAWALHALALSLFRVGRKESSLAVAAESLTLAQSVGHVQAVSLELVFAAALATQHGDADVGGKLLGAAQMLSERFVMSYSGVEAELHDETVDALRQALGDAGYETALGEGRSMPLEEAIAQALKTLRTT
jgi:non-specific serine/threonine protein kinase